MAQESVKILKGKIDVAKVLELLNAALSEEWLAYYQYWIGAKMVSGIERADIASAFRRHASDELAHAGKIIDRIIELEGVPVLTPGEWALRATCAFEAPTSFDSEYLVKRMLANVQCAMQRFEEMAQYTEDRDFITSMIVKKILSVEADHEEDLQNYLEDIAALKNPEEAKKAEEAGEPEEE
ncbi:MAG: ferritin-like domain-containing protein [Muribaculaceae bacterium]|nr:ferritin-like domain-containing protein [Muribaculaceae bacterium]